MEVSIERLIEMIVKEVSSELSKNGIIVSRLSEKPELSGSPVCQKQLCEIIDLRNYKSPVLTENHLASLEPSVQEIILPRGTVITPGAKDIISKRRLIIRSNFKTN